ncbi:MAG TPA: class 1 fructose-bisphosphatase [Candidatus Polarisedimenticolia bacterium]|nr:class 1 fructose-bisphosphatase [Candidatus Polarisedimenticolia bacterium]
MTEGTIGGYVASSPALQGDARTAIGELCREMARAGVAIAREVRRAALTGRLGYAGGENVTGDRQKKLDVVGNDLVLDVFRRSPHVAAIVSEEDAQPVPTGRPDAPYILSTDPIDGSSNTDIDGAVGTIFSFSHRPTGGGMPRGSDIAAAGYILYGPSTLFAISAGAGAAAFTFDDEKNRWALTHPALRCPERGRTFSANLGRARAWHQHLQAYLDYVTDDDKATGRPYSLRYIGALVGDLHRCLIEGGLYFYPPDAKNTQGKLRLMYECLPLAFLAEQAGGKASDGTRRLLDVEAGSAHARSPFVVGSAAEVDLYDTFMRTGKPA